MMKQRYIIAIAAIWCHTFLLVLYRFNGSDNIYGKKTTDNRKVLMERFDVRDLRASYIRRITNYRTEGRPIVYTGMEEMRTRLRSFDETQMVFFLILTVAVVMYFPVKKCIQIDINHPNVCMRVSMSLCLGSAFSMLYPIWLINEKCSIDWYLGVVLVDILLMAFLWFTCIIGGYLKDRCSNSDRLVENGENQEL